MIEHIKKYLGGLKDVIDTLDLGELDRAVKLLKSERKNNRQIFVVGNGGSTATANHFLCDFGKNAVKSDEGRFKIVSLCSSVEVITAYANDVAYEVIFEEQLKNLMNHGDIIMAISASGNSPNIINAVRYAKEKQGVIVGLTGGDGGKLKQLADIRLHVESDVIEQVEDVHLIFEHIIVYLFKNNPKLLA